MNTSKLKKDFLIVTIDDANLLSKFYDLRNSRLSSKEGLICSMLTKNEQEGKLFNKCMDIWEKIGKSSSVRIKAFEFLMKTASKYPELKNELKYLTNTDYTKSLSPGIKKSLQKFQL